MTNAEFETEFHKHVNRYASEIMSGKCECRNARTYARSASAIVSLFDGLAVLARCPGVAPSGANIVRTEIIPTLDKFRLESIESRLDKVRKMLSFEPIPLGVIAHAVRCDTEKMTKFIASGRELEALDFFGAILFMEMFHQAVESEIYRRRRVAKLDTSICTTEPCKGDDV